MPKLIDASSRSTACGTGLVKRGHAMQQCRRDGLHADGGNNHAYNVLEDLGDAT